MMKNKILFLFLILVAPLLVASPYGFREGAFQGSFEAGYFYSKQNISSSGSVVELPSANQFSEYRGLIGAGYDFFDFWGVYSNLSIKRVQSLGYPVERVRTGLSELLLGTDVEVFSGFIKIIPDMSVTIPLHETEPIGSVLIDDSAYKVTARLFISRQWFKRFWTVAYGGYQYVTEGLSSNIPYGFSVRHQLGIFSYELSAYGQESLKNDTHSSSFRNSVLLDLNAGSFQYRSYNPSYTLGQVKLGLNFDSIATYLAAETTLQGQNTSQGIRAMGGLVYTFDPGPKKPPEDPFKPDLSESEVEIKTNAK